MPSLDVVPSYVSGKWHRPSGGDPVRDAVTGDELVRVSTDGLDVAAALEYGRDVGGPALRALTFHQRAAIIEGAATLLRGHREELYELSARTGATRADARFDVDGGIGVLLAYARRAIRELPDDTVLVEGDVERIGKQRFVGQHVCVPRLGVAIQINAFNFPVWGPLEKLAPAVLAGVASVIKPSSQTAFLTARVVELLIDGGAFPEGTVQLISGPARDLLDHVTEQDTVAFTGSSGVASALRTHPAIVSHSARFSAEADSLNCSVLGPDVTVGSLEFGLYVDQLVREMSIKAGQKCTAIRRAIVPVELFDAVIAAAAERLAEVVVGNPASPDVTLGALVSLEHRNDVRRAVANLARCGRIVAGDPERVQPLDADPERGAFMSPVLIGVDQPDRSEPHEVEAFGPVAAVMPYTSLEHAVELAARGRGSLAGSIVTGDADVARRLVLGLAPWHGRMLVLDADIADESTGHGAPLPGLVHGGPGRAGGGEELGGIRAVLHHMQRTAVQGSPDLLTSISGTWVRGSRRSASSDHPFRKSLGQLRIGDSVTAGPRVVTEADIEHFASFTGDTFYAHLDAEAAAANPLFGGIVAHGYLVLSFAAGLFVSPEPGPVLANYGLERLRFTTPVKPGDAITVALTAKQITPRPGTSYGEVRWDATVTNQRGETVATYDVLTLVAR